MQYTPASPSGQFNSTKTRRKSTGKRLRFEIFKRDLFTCQYCGAQPPDVTLVVDHIHPVNLGGSNTADNMITACEPCNQGKADKPLGERVVRPDADLLHLQTQQEIAELRRYHDALETREAVTLEIIGDLQNLWGACSGLTWSPADHTLRSMMNRYSPELVESVIRDVAPKVGSGYVSSNGTEWLKYMNAVARNIALDWNEQEGE